MPPSASSKSPFFCWRASVKAPRSWPKSSLSRSVLRERRAGDVHEGPAAAAAARRGCTLAARSLPVPVSPGDQHRRGRARGDPPQQALDAPASARDSPTMSSTENAGLPPAPVPRGSSRPSSSVRCSDLPVEQRVVDRAGGEVAHDARASLLVALAERGPRPRHSTAKTPTSRSRISSGIAICVSAFGQARQRRHARPGPRRRPARSISLRTALA